MSAVTCAICDGTSRRCLVGRPNWIYTHLAVVIPPNPGELLGAWIDRAIHELEAP